MKRNLKILIGAILIALIAPMAAQTTPSSAIDNYREAVAKPSTPPIINPMDPNYVWGNPLAIDLRNINPVIFQNPAFANERGGILGSSLYTTSINDFLKADEKAGYSSVPKKAAKIGLVATLDKTSVPINTLVNASLNTSQNETISLSESR
jgi:hypothetical protein